MNALGRSLFLIVFTSMVTACGKKGPLIYPDMLVPAAPVSAVGYQSGPFVKLQFILTDKDKAGRPVQGVTGVKIRRKGSETVQKDVCRSCLTDYLLLQTVYLDHLSGTAQRIGNQVIYLDGEVRAGNSYSYLVTPFMGDGTDGASAAIADIRVTTPLPGPELKIESLPTEVKITFSGQPPIAGRLLGYNLYRTTGDGGNRSYQPLNKQPLTNSEFIDSNLERGVKYRYRGRTVMTLATGGTAESLESPEVEGMLKDDE